tara:strand:+ start:371 stop:1276 length:906 start_codon:yes stop_codon:yes gene_type:complete
MKKPNIRFLKNTLLLFFFFSFFSEPLKAKEKILRIGAIPDQNQEILDKRFNLLSEELSKQLDIKIEYVPVVSYVAAVTAFRTNSLDLVWFGGLSGVQARLQTPNSVVLAQRDIDKEFKSVFITNKKFSIKKTKKLKDLKLLTKYRFTFGSENSTSGRLMPQYFLDIAGIKLTDFKGQNVGFSGSHDATIALVNSGAYDVGVLNKQVWDRNLKENPKRVKNSTIFFITPSYVDYHWLAKGNLDQIFRNGFTKELKEVILNLDPKNKNQKLILEMFNAEKFIEANSEQYKNIEFIARKLKKIR